MMKTTSAMIRKTECELLINSTANSHIHLFCNASKGTDGTAAIAVYNPLKNSYIQLKLSNNTPIYAAELIAIHSTISWLFINATPHSKAIIFTDCLSALNSIKACSSKSHPTIIHNLLHIIHQIYIKKFITIEICHIFSHIGVASNEVVDAAANLARLRPIVNLLTEPEYGDIKHYVFAYIYKLWHQQSVDHNKSGAFYKLIRPSLNTSVPIYSTIRKNQVINVRLRTDHNLLAASLHTGNLHDSRLCFCGKQQTTEHLLLDSICPLYKKQKEEFLHKIKILNASLTIINILKYNQKSSRCNKLCSFYS